MSSIALTQRRFTKALVASIMRDPTREWTAQGFGFLRTYFGPPDVPKRYRLNLWHSALTVPNVSTIHDHPWNFTSLVVAGAMSNIVYKIDDQNEAPTHHYAKFRTGVEMATQVSDDVKSVTLIKESIHDYTEGYTYYQNDDVIHETRFTDGTVTLNERIGDTEHARIFWPFGEEWVNAKPRVAMKPEVQSIINYSLNRWFV
jgi:hypothetical protein